MTTWTIQNDQTFNWTAINSNGDSYYFVSDYCVTDYVEVIEPWSNESDGVTEWQSL